MRDDDNSIFLTEMSGVKRIHTDRADTGKQRDDRQQIASRRQNATVLPATVKVDVRHRCLGRRRTLLGP